MKISLDSLGVLAALRHAASRDKDRVMLSGVQLEPSSDGIVGRSTNSYIAARRIVDGLPDHLYDGDDWSASVSGADLAAAVAAFNARSDDDNGSSPINVEFLVDAGGVPSGIELELEASQPALFDEESSFATYRVRVVSTVVFPEVDGFLDVFKVSRPASVVGLDPSLLVALLKTSGDAKAPVAVAVHGEHEPVLFTHVQASSWRAALMTMSIDEEEQAL